MKKQKDLEYPVRGFRISDKTWEQLKKLKGKQSWNLFFLELVKSKGGKNGKHKNI